MSYNYKNEFTAQVMASCRFTVPKCVRKNLNLVHGDIIYVGIEKIDDAKKNKNVNIKSKLQESQFEKDVGIEPELLWSLLWGNGYTVSHIAKLFSCGYVTILEGMKQYDIPIPGYGHHDKEQILETSRECTRRRRLKEKELSEVFTPEEWLKKVEDTNGKCPVCGHSYMEGGGLTLDHILPVAKAPSGFCYTIDDVMPVCRSCNSAKSDKIDLLCTL